MPRLATSWTSTRWFEGSTKTELLDLAREVDSGFDVRVFLDMPRHLTRYSDFDLALGDVDIPALRAFFSAADRRTGVRRAVSPGRAPTPPRPNWSGTMEGLDVAMAEVWSSIDA